MNYTDIRDAYHVHAHLLSVASLFQVHTLRLEGKVEVLFMD